MRRITWQFVSFIRPLEVKRRVNGFHIHIPKTLSIQRLGRRRSVRYNTKDRMRELRRQMSELMAQDYAGVEEV